MFFLHIYIQHKVTINIYNFAHYQFYCFRFSMKKKIENHKTLFTNYYHSPTICNTFNKISYLPSLNFNFEELVQNRLKAEISEVPKSIFVLKYKLKKQDLRYSQGEKRSTNFPQLSISTTLDSPKKDSPNKDSPRKKHTHESIKAPSLKNFNHNFKVYKKRHTPTLFEYSNERNHQNVYQKSFIRQRSNEKQKSFNGKDEMIIGNKTILNFRSTSLCNQTKSKKIKTKNKIKFGTFQNPISDICPWGLSDGFDQMQ